jgi:hypothetical protein
MMICGRALREGYSRGREEKPPVRLGRTDKQAMQILRALEGRISRERGKPETAVATKRQRKPNEDSQTSCNKHARNLSVSYGRGPSITLCFEAKTGPSPYRQQRSLKIEVVTTRHT